ncbi:hypothetical protein AP75_01890 [Kaistella haifensis DSM 19056]|uniref:Uncharacterized protein n=1 Tax=Kaistella haifensis DSM 19056 TaxID=1450526 RepID=A0A246BC62_9FLAO|nr:hypothetical protein [Kaistella haifensis]OWK99262.1 hypothetical protein AP75_01890 [Kaistella haifensis DSM 19056]
MSQTEDLKNVFAKRQAKEAEKAKNDKSPVVKDLSAFVKRFTQKKLDEWKEENANRELIYLKVDDFLAVLRPPTAEDLGDYLTAIGVNGMSKAVAMIIEQLWLEGDYQLIEDEDLFIAVFLQINNILEGKKGEFFRA